MTTDNTLTSPAWITNEMQEEEAHEDICFHCMFLQMQETNDNLAAEVYELKGAVESLLKVIQR